MFTIFDEDVQIPDPIAPARPGGIIYGTDPNGNQIVITPTTATNTATGATLPTLSGSTAPDTNATGRAGALGIDTTNPAQYAASPAGGYAPAWAKWIQAHVEDFVFIIAGLILIGAAAFSFKGTQTVIETATKAAAKVAA